MKICRVCGVEKPFSDYYKHKGLKDGHQNYCKACHVAQNKAWAEKNPGARTEMYRRHVLKKKYGLTFDEYHAMVEAQNGCCKICQEPFKAECKNGTNVDHNHKTGEVRGLLCNNCNPMLGNARDKIEYLERAVSYLKENGSYG